MKKSQTNSSLIFKIPGDREAKIMKIGVLLLCCTLMLTSQGLAQQKIKVYVSEIKGPDQFINERFKLLFMEELSKVKSVELVTSKSDAQLLLEGVGRLDTLQQSSVSGSANQTGAVISGSGGETPNAMLSITVTDAQTSKIVFVGNKSKVSGGFFSKGATHGAVSDLVKDLKKKLKWK